MNKLNWNFRLAIMKNQIPVMLQLAVQGTKQGSRERRIILRQIVKLAKLIEASKL